MNKLLREHAAWRAYQDALEPPPRWMEHVLFDEPGKPLRALNRRVRPRARRRLPRHVPLGAKLIRRLNTVAGKRLAQPAAAAAALRVVGGNR